MGVYGLMTNATLNALRYNLIREMVLIVYDPLHGNEGVRDAILQHIRKAKGGVKSAAAYERNKVRCKVTHKPSSEPKSVAKHEPAQSYLALPHDAGDLWCNKCQLWKKPSEFTKDRTKKTGYRSTCKPCEPRYQGRIIARPRNKPSVSQDGCKEGEHRCVVCGLVADKMLFTVNYTCKDGHSFTCRPCKQAQDRVAHAKKRGIT